MVVSGRVDPSNPAYVECCWGVSFLLYQAVKFTNQPRRALAVFWPWTGCWECPAVFPTCPSPCPCPLLFVVCKNLQPPSSPTLRLIPNPFCPAFPACLPDHLPGIFTSWRLFLLSSSSVFPRLPLANPPFLAASVFSRYRFLAVCCEPQALTSSCKLSSSRKH